jgi:hypothetical protein
MALFPAALPYRPRHFGATLRRVRTPGSRFRLAAPSVRALIPKPSGVHETGASAGALLVMAWSAAPV